MEAILQAQSSNVFLFFSLGYCIFHITNRCVGKYPPQSALESRQNNNRSSRAEQLSSEKNSSTPSTGTESKLQWKWRNVATSLIHSIITGVWAPLVFYQSPGMCEDIIHAYSPATLALTAFSTGYFVYDAQDMLTHRRHSRSTYELLVHHTCVVSCFSTALLSRQYLAYAALSLIVEVNSVFLHSRQLLILYGEPKSTLRYKVNAMLNIVTFLLFRILTLGWMTRWLTINRDHIPLPFFCLGTLGLVVIVLMNIVLFCRVLVADFPSAIPFARSKLGNTNCAKHAIRSGSSSTTAIRSTGSTTKTRYTTTTTTTTTTTDNNSDNLIVNGREETTGSKLD